MTTAKPLARYSAIWGRPRERLCYAELHHHTGRDRPLWSPLANAALQMGGHKGRPHAEMCTNEAKQPLDAKPLRAQGCVLEAKRPGEARPSAPRCGKWRLLLRHDDGRRCRRHDDGVSGRPEAADEADVVAVLAMHAGDLGELDIARAVVGRDFVTVALTQGRPGNDAAGVVGGDAPWAERTAGLGRPRQHACRGDCGSQNPSHGNTRPSVRDPRPCALSSPNGAAAQAAQALSISALTASSASGVSMSTRAAVAVGTSTTASP